MADEISRSETSNDSITDNEHRESPGSLSRSQSPNFDKKHITGAVFNENNKENSSPTKNKSNVDDLSDIDFQEEKENESDKLNESKDLSDVSDDDFSSLGKRKSNIKDEGLELRDLRLKLDEKKVQLTAKTSNNINLVNDEDALDFEAEEGECCDVKEAESKNLENLDKKLVLSDPEEGEELEEGEVTDEDDRRPEENEPKPVCRFYTRGQCTWGISCRFLHPGVTDKGNYTMFDMVRPVPAQQGFAHIPFHEGFREIRQPVHHVLPHHHSTYEAVPTRPQTLPESSSESAWERGLRTAKEMMRKANKRKEQDIDFEDKKMNMSLSQDELEKDNYYIKDRSSPEVHSFERQIAYSSQNVVPRISNVGQDEDQFGRFPRYRFRELPPHRMPHFEDDIKRRARSTREVIVQRADEWSDPWMRSKSPARSNKRKSYSSNSSYSSSSSSSQSGSSSESSRSPTPARNRRYVRPKSDIEHLGPQKKYVRVGSPSRKRLSPGYKNNSPKRHEARMGSPKRTEKPLTPKRKRATSPQNRKVSGISSKKKPGSSSDTSESSESDSDSSNSSSSDSSTSSRTKNVRARDVALTERKTATKKVEMCKKRFSPTADAKMSAANTTGKKSNRREELLKQLKAVEDAIARKRSKIN